MKNIDFFFSIGSRYSYLAATQIPALARETGARFFWRAVNSRDLIERAGSDPFATQERRGQYLPAYRTRDAARWAAFYGVPYREPDWTTLNSRLVAFACVAAERLGAGELFAQKLFALCFVEGKSPSTAGDLVSAALAVGIDPATLETEIQSGNTAQLHQKNLDEAAVSGAFGVPSFVVDGELYWGQDRLTLLRNYLLRPGQQRTRSSMDD